MGREEERKQERMRTKWQRSVYIDQTSNERADGTQALRVHGWVINGRGYKT